MCFNNIHLHSTCITINQYYCKYYNVANHVAYVTIIDYVRIYSPECVIRVQEGNRPISAIRIRIWSNPCWKNDDYNHIYYLLLIQLLYLSISTSQTTWLTRYFQCVFETKEWDHDQQVYFFSWDVYKRQIQSYGWNKFKTRQKIQDICLEGWACPTRMDGRDDSVHT